MECYCCGKEMQEEFYDVYYHTKKVCKKCFKKHTKNLINELKDYGKIVYPYRYKISQCARCGKDVYDEWAYDTRHDVFLCLDCGDEKIERRKGKYVK